MLDQKTTIREFFLGFGEAWTKYKEEFKRKYPNYEIKIDMGIICELYFESEEDELIGWNKRGALRNMDSLPEQGFKDVTDNEKFLNFCQWYIDKYSK